MHGGSDVVLAVSVHDLSKKYGDFLALDGINLKVRAGKIFAILGPNGAGKTTLMRILTTQFEPTEGVAFVLGRNVATEGDEVRRLVSYVPQEMSVWTDITGIENLLIYAKIYGLPVAGRKEMITAALKTMGLERVQNQLVSTYSGGMIRKLEIASAIMLNPRILFLDEPTIGLDPAARKTVWDKLQALNRENRTSVFFSTHYMDEADENADEIAIIDAGRIVKTGSPKKLKQSVGNEIITVELKSPLNHAIVERLRTAVRVENVEVSGSSLRVFVKDSAASLATVVRFLEKNHAGVRSVVASNPTLEDVFLKYAGRNAGGDAGDGRKLGRADKSRSMNELRATRKRIMRGG